MQNMLVPPAETELDQVTGTGKNKPFVIFMWVSALRQDMLVRPGKTKLDQYTGTGKDKPS